MGKYSMEYSGNLPELYNAIQCSRSFSAFAPLDQRHLMCPALFRFEGWSAVKFSYFMLYDDRLWSVCHNIWVDNDRCQANSHAVNIQIPSYITSMNEWKRNMHERH